MISERYGPDAPFASARAEENFDKAVDSLMLLIGTSNLDGARHVVRAITAYIMRDYADRAKLISNTPMITDLKENGQ